MSMINVESSYSCCGLQSSKIVFLGGRGEIYHYNKHRLVKLDGKILSNKILLHCCSLQIWSVKREDERYTVSHSEEVTCFVLTMDSLHVITGSRDMSLKVWQVTGGKLAQVSQKGSCIFISW